MANAVSLDNRCPAVVSFIDSAGTSCLHLATRRAGHVHQLHASAYASLNSSRASAPCGCDHGRKQESLTNARGARIAMVGSAICCNFWKYMRSPHVGGPMVKVGFQEAGMRGIEERACCRDCGYSVQPVPLCSRGTRLAKEQCFKPDHPLPAEVQMMIHTLPRYKTLLNAALALERIVQVARPPRT